MGKTTGIDWCTATWNPHHGCHKVDAGCTNCYMFREKKRFGQDPTKVVRSKPATFNAPLKWKEPQLIFVCSWSDFFIEEADEWRDEAIDVMRRAPQHTYMILTKRPDLVSSIYSWPDNIWIGVSVAQRSDLWRVNTLGLIDVRTRFVSIEPMLEPINLTGYTAALDWIICGCESGPNRRPFEADWARTLCFQCQRYNIPFFYKQGRDAQNRVVKMPKLDGEVWAEYPDGDVT